MLTKDLYKYLIVNFLDGETGLNLAGCSKTVWNALRAPELKSLQRKRACISLQRLAKEWWYENLSVNVTFFRAKLSDVAAYGRESERIRYLKTLRDFDSGKMVICDG